MILLGDIDGTLDLHLLYAVLLEKRYIPSLNNDGVLPIHSYMALNCLLRFLVHFSYSFKCI